MTNMTAARIHEFGGPEVLRLETLDKPVPGPNEVLIRIRAASVNPVDFKTRAGAYPAVKREQLPVTLGRDISGVVESVGKAVRDLKPNDEVYALLDREHGAFADYVVLDGKLCTAKPRKLSHVEAAAVPLAALTAWQGLFDQGHLQPNQRVLIHGGAGGVGHMAVQLAKAKGARVFTTVGAGDLDFVRELGADQAIDHDAERFEEQLSDIDVVFDLVGGDTQKRSWQVLKQGGVLVSTLGQPPEDQARAHEARGAGYLAEANASQLEQVRKLIDDGKVHVVVQAKYPLRDIAKAQHAVEHEHVRGKVVVEVS